MTQQAARVATRRSHGKYPRCNELAGLRNSTHAATEPLCANKEPHDTMRRIQEKRELRGGT